MKPLCQVLNNQNGSILLIGLLVISLVTIIGVAALTTSNLELQIAANDKVHQIAFYHAEGAYQSVFSVFDAIRTGADPTDFDTDYPTFGFAGSGNDFWEESLGDADSVTANPDVIITALNSAAVDVDQAETDAAGESIINRAGYEGLGKSAAGNWVAAYDMNILGTAALGARTLLDINAKAVR